MSMSLSEVVGRNGGKNGEHLCQGKQSKCTLSRLETADKLREQYTYLLFLMGI